MTDERERWLNGWYRRGSGILVGTMLCCAGCGRHLGLATVDLRGASAEPKKEPDWPFNRVDCPVCGGDSHAEAQTRLRTALERIRKIGQTDNGRLVSEAARIADGALKGD